MKTKFTLVLIVVAAALGFGLGKSLTQSSLLSRHRAELSGQHIAWEAEKAALEAALAKAQNRRAPQPSVPPPQIIQVTNSTSPAEILALLKSMRAPANDPRAARLLVRQFEELISTGTNAVPVISEFLARNEDREYEAGIGRGWRNGKVPLEFAVPPSLRLGLLEALKIIGGPAAEEALLTVLQSTGRGLEVAYLAGALQEMAPNKHREAVLASARELLLRPLTAGLTSPLDKFDRECLYGVLGFLNDGSSVPQAQAQLIRADGKVDRVALNYLKQVMGEQSIAVAAQAWQDPRVAADQKEPLARVALAYAGVNPQADQLFQAAINDPAMSAPDRQNLIEDLNETGFADPKNIQPGDLALIEKRLKIIEDSAPTAMDAENLKAFKEAYKDLTEMRNKLIAQSAPVK